MASRIIDGQAQPIPPSEYIAWSKMTGNIVYPREYDILREMDFVYCQETNKEITARRSIAEDKRQMELELNSRNKRR